MGMKSDDMLPVWHRIHFTVRRLQKNILMLELQIIGVYLNKTIVLLIDESLSLDCLLTFIVLTPPVWGSAASLCFISVKISNFFVFLTLGWTSYFVPWETVRFIFHYFLTINWQEEENPQINQVKIIFNYRHIFY